ASMGKVAENLIQFASKASLFWREANKEVDFVLQDGSRILPVESKYTSKIRMRDLKGLLRFMDKFGVDTGLVITEDYEASEVYKGFNIQFVPLWKYVLGITPQKTI
ncbi:MAG: ATP-binding protein, partial [Bacteroidetes bacterium]|nr:ATP-binding protein [Bacteroidota bacterium]